MDKDLQSMSIPQCQLSEMKNKLEQYQKKQTRWNQQRQKMAKNLILMEQEIKKQRNINAALLKKSQHKRTCSDEQTFIFNQTNISSYYPVMLLNQVQKQQGQKQKKQGQETGKNINKRDGTQSPSPNSHNINSNSNIKNVVSVNSVNGNNNLQSSSNTNTYVNSTSTHQGTIFNPNSNSWIPRANLRSHLDSVRTLRWQGQFLISAGEDCLLKIWEKDKLRITVREHLAPVFCLCGDQTTVFSGGAEGVVRKWMVDTFLESGRPVAQVELHDDSIWDIIWISKYQLLVTSSSDNSMKLLKSNSSSSLVLHSQININPDTPTSICSIQNEFIGCGLVKSKKINLYNIERPSRTSSTLAYQNSENENWQSNKLLYLNKKNLLISGHQDHNLRLFDISSSTQASIIDKNIGSIVAHSDAVTSLCVRENNKKQHEIISSSHDGTVRVWDVRKWKCIHDIGIHMKKYDQSLLALAYGGESDLLAVGGADGQIKLLSPQI